MDGQRPEAPSPDRHVLVVGGTKVREQSAQEVEQTQAKELAARLLAYKDTTGETQLARLTPENAALIDAHGVREFSSFIEKLTELIRLLDAFILSPYEKIKLLFGKMYSIL